MIAGRCDAEAVSLESLLRYSLGLDTGGDRYFTWKKGDTSGYERDKLDS